MTLTVEQLAGCCRCSLNRAADWLDPINAALDAFGIDTPVRVAAFLAQIGHESGYLQWTRELWGPTEQQLRYDPPSPLARELGNTFPGDGKLYRGAGLIETTGRANFARTRDKLRAAGIPDVPDFEAEPDKLALPQWAALSAAEFWADHELNDLADGGGLECFAMITKAINGGTNGETDRVALWGEACNTLGVPQ